jgi:bacterioferritin-associated ferredoxin
MYVCLCRAVCERRVGEAIGQGASTVEAVGQMTGAGTDCGGCHRTIARALSRAGALRTSPDKGCDVAEGVSQPG